MLHPKYFKLKTTRTKGYENMGVTGCLFSNSLQLHIVILKKKRNYILPCNYVRKKSVSNFF